MNEAVILLPVPDIVVNACNTSVGKIEPEEITKARTPFGSEPEGRATLIFL